MIKHISNIFNDGELHEALVVRFYRTTAFALRKGQA